MSCAVCAKHLSLEGLPGGVIYQNEFIFVAHFPLFSEPSAFKPHYGHIILDLKRHITSPAVMTDEEASQVGLWLQRISHFLERDLAAEHTYQFRIGDKTPHLHFHIVPRFPDTPHELWGIYLFESPVSRKADTVDIQNISAKMRQAFLGK